MEMEEMEVHNAVPEFSDPLNGWLLPRYPLAVRDALSPRGQLISANSTGVELRFVTPGRQFRVTLANPGERMEVTVRKGSFWKEKLHLEAGATRGFIVEEPGGFGTVEKSALASGQWDAAVWRLQFDGPSPVLLDLDPMGEAIRPPRGAEKPARRWLAYGSSITNADLQGYVFIAAQDLRVDVLNKGLSGSCHIEPEAADWLASLDFDFATLELGINMRGQFEPPEFEKRVRYLYKVLRERHPKTPLVLITHFLNRDHHVAGELSKVARHQLAYDTILLDLHAGADDPNLHLVEGTEILDDFSLLTADFIHPTHEGHARMGRNLANQLRELLGI
ncbi:MAG: SGNH/GDSL hydrolase family protein [Oceanipulchritudo sp.]